MVNKATGLSKGYGFVSFAFLEDAKSAIEAMDGFRVRISLFTFWFLFSDHQFSCSWGKSA
jgi:RNA recognition motif-containing protein